jgi:pimeloyl-ACP methyl ester carboxylesterase
MPVVDLHQGALNYRALGPEDSTEPPVVFVHPILADGRLWEPVADLLAGRGIRSYAPDWPLGSHRHPLHADADRSPRGIAAMVRDFLAALDLDDVTLVGNDTGGALTQYVLDSGEPRVGRAVLMNCDAFDTFPPFPFNVSLAPLRFAPVARLLAPLMAWTPLRHSSLGFGMLSRNLPPELTRSWLQPTREDAGVRRDLAGLMRTIDPDELLAVSTRLGDVTVPVTVLWGMADTAFRPSLGRRLVEAFADAEWVEVPGARTLLALDAPDVVADAVAAIAHRAPAA